MAMIGGEGHAPLSPEADALQKAQHYQKRRRCDTQHVEAGQEPYKGRSEAHYKEREHEHRLASQPVAEVPEDHGAEGPRQKRGCEGRESRERLGDLREPWEEQRSEGEGGGETVDVEVVRC